MPGFAPTLEHLASAGLDLQGQALDVPGVERRGQARGPASHLHSPIEKVAVLDRAVFTHFPKLVGH